MARQRILLLTDVEDSTRITEHLGDEAASSLWAVHDRTVRSLMRQWRGREIDKSDGFLLLFDSVSDAAACALALHQALATLTPPLMARAGIHKGPLVERETSTEDRASGGKPLEVDGLAKAVAARIMMLARGGQTLLSADAANDLAADDWPLQPRGHWRMKGASDPIELFELVDALRPLPPPADSPKSYRVQQVGQAWMPVATMRHGLPAERDAFIGRAAVLSDLAARFDGGARLVSLVGLGGIGKTRLAQRYARQWLGDYPGGAWFCDLSPCRDADGLLQAVARGLDVPLGKTDALHQLGAAIAGRGPCLVILDNFEQVVRHAETTIGRWLEQAPELRLLVTSRTVLGIAGEQVLALAPLDVQDAVQLFRTRAGAADGRGAGQVDDEPDLLPRLVDLLDHLPLAIELAAARVRVMSPRSMFNRMDERFRLLAAAGGRPDRQATLRATLDWSWDLLSAPEKLALAQLSVFRDGFSHAAAEAVIDLSGWPDAPWTTDVLQSLVDQSLVRRVDVDRLRLLHTVQAYAAEWLAMLTDQGQGNPGVGARRRHWLHYAAITEAEAARLGGLETANLVEACGNAAVAGDAPAAARLLVAAWAAIRLHGPLSEAHTLAAKVLSCDAIDAASEATALWASAAAHFQTGAVMEARRLIERAMALGCTDALTAARLGCVMADIEATSGRGDQAMALLDQALADAQRAADAQTRCRVLNAQAALMAAQGQSAAARNRYREALAIAQDSGDVRWQAGVLGNLAGLDHAEGRLQDARTAYACAYDLACVAGDRRWMGNVQCNLGLLLLDQGQAADAEPLLRSALALAREIGLAELEGIAGCNLGLLAEGRGALDEACRLFRTALDGALGRSDRHLAGLCRAYLGRCLARRGDLAAAEALLAWADDSALDDAVAGGLLDCAKAELALRLGQRDAPLARLAAARGRLAAGGGGHAELAAEVRRIEALLAESPRR